MFAWIVVAQYLLILALVAGSVGAVGWWVYGPVAGITATGIVLAFGVWIGWGRRQ
jgi:hypothetical protein